MKKYKFNRVMAVLGAAVTLSVCQAAFAETVEMNLEDAMIRAFNNNPAISIADYEMKAAKANYDAAKQSHFLSIKGTHSSGRGGYNHLYYGDKNISNSHSNTITASLPIYYGGELAGARKQARASYKAAVAGKQGAWNDMRSTVTNAYCTVLHADNLQKLGKESVERLKDHLKNVQAQYDVGVVAKVDVLRSQVEVSDAEQSLIQAQNSYQLAVAQLDKIVGLPLSTDLKLDNILIYTPYDKEMDYCLAYAADHRPELEKAKQNIEAKRGALLSARSGYQPKIGVSATQNFGGNNYNNNWPGDGKKNWTAGVSVSMNLFDSGVTYSKIHAAKENLSAAEETYRETVDSINLDVRQNYLNMREAEKRIQTTDVAVEQAQEDYRIAKLRYMAGVGTNTDVIDASVALTKAQSNYLKALYDFNTCKTDLQTAIGDPMLWPTKVTVEPAVKEAK